MKVLIVGAGIGGLTAAIALAERGIDAEIFERADALRELGVGINTLPHAIRELARLGLLDALDRNAIRTGELIYKTANGQDILRQPRGTDAGLDYPQFSIHRGRLQKLLVDAAMLRGQNVRLGHRLESFTQDENGVTALFQTPGGLVERSGDVLIGADGIHSTLRRAWHGDEGPPAWNGVEMWRGAAWWPSFLTGRSMIIAGGMSAKLVLYPIMEGGAERPGECLTNWVVCARTGEPGNPPPSREDWSRKADANEALRHLDGIIHVPEIDVPALIAATEEIYVYPMCDRDPLDSWTDRRVTLLGDAAHPMYPVGSNGASQAILDAVCLADALASHPPQEALAAYEAERRPATASIVLANRQGGPERVIDLVEQRAPDGFDDLDDVASRAEIEALVGEYQKMAGFTAAQVNA